MISRRLINLTMRVLIFCCTLAAPAAVFGQPADAWQDRTVDQWVGQLADDDHGARWYAAYALGQIGPPAAAAVDELTTILKDRGQNEYVRCTAAWALGRIGPAAEPAVDALVEVVRSDNDRDRRVRRDAARALGAVASQQTPTAAQRAVAVLAGVLKDEDAAVRVSAAVALWKINQDPQATETLLAMAGSRQQGIACEAVAGLGEVAGPPQPVVSALVAACCEEDADQDVRRAAARALGQVGPPAIHALKRALAAEDQDVRRSAVEALGWVGPQAVPALIDALADESAAVRRAAAQALGRLGTAAQEAQPALIKALSDPDQHVRQAAAAALKKPDRPR